MMLLIRVRVGRHAAHIHTIHRQTDKTDRQTQLAP